MNHDAPGRSRSASWLAALALLLSGAVVGVFAGRWSASSANPVHDPALATREPATESPGLDELRRSIDELARALRERPISLAAPAPRSDSVSRERQTALPDSAGLDRLASAVERLDELLRSGSNRSGSAPAPSRTSFGTPIGPGYPSLAAMRGRIEAIRSAHPDDVDSYANREFSQAHVLWTRDDVIERYGLPKQVQAQGDQGLNLVYEGFDTLEERCYFAFSTRIERGSLVTDVGFFCGSKDDR